MTVNYSEIAEALKIPEKHIPLLIGSFINESVTIFEQLSEAIASQDYEKIGLHAHSLKGSAANLRLTPISDLALTMEQAGKAADAAYDYEGKYSELKALVDSIPQP